MTQFALVELRVAQKLKQIYEELLELCNWFTQRLDSVEHVKTNLVNFSDLRAQGGSEFSHRKSLDIRATEPLDVRRFIASESIWHRYQGRH